MRQMYFEWLGYAIANPTYNTKVYGNSIGSYAGNALLAYASKALFRPTAQFIIAAPLPTVKESVCLE